MDQRVETSLEAARKRLDEIWQLEADHLKRPCRHCERGIGAHCPNCGACDEPPCGEVHHHERKFTPTE